MRNFKVKRIKPLLIYLKKHPNINLTFGVVEKRIERLNEAGKEITGIGVLKRIPFKKSKFKEKIKEFENGCFYNATLKNIKKMVNNVK
jgi:hypothetical protein